jgi:hypothetical protein
MTFPESEQQKHRATFIDECRQKAWGAACHADFIGKQLDGIAAEYAKEKEVDDTIEASPDYHTVENREKRKTLAAGMKLLKENLVGGQSAMQNLLQNMESNLALAKHAEGWGWKEMMMEQPTEPHQLSVSGPDASR